MCEREPIYIAATCERERQHRSARASGPAFRTRTFTPSDGSDRSRLDKTSRSFHRQGPTEPRIKQGAQKDSGEASFPETKTNAPKKAQSSPTCHLIHTASYINRLTAIDSVAAGENHKSVKKKKRNPSYAEAKRFVASVTSLLRSAAEPRRRPAPRGGANPGCLRACRAVPARPCAASPATTRSRPPPPARTASSLGLGVPNPPPHPNACLRPPPPPLIYLSLSFPPPFYFSLLLLLLRFNPCSRLSFRLVCVFDTVFCWIGLVLIGCSLSRPDLHCCGSASAAQRGGTFAVLLAVSLCKSQASHFMDGGSCGLEGAPVVTSGGNSPTSAGIPLLPEKHRASFDETCGAAEGSTGPEGVPVATSADNSLARTGIPLPCDSVDETCESAAGGTAPLEAQICTGFSKSISLEVKKGLQKCATFPHSSGQPQQEDRSCCHAADGLTGAPAYERSVSLPPVLKLIPAMKGGREKNGIASPTENRHVKWAPDVYDPPVTSVCHSVTNSYQRRSKHRKKEKNKQKKKQKGKSKKNQQNSTQNSSVPQVPDLGLKGVSTTGGQSSVDDLSKHEAGIMDYSMGSQEAKCGSSFLRESVAKMHFSIAEAS